MKTICSLKSRLLLTAVAIVVTLSIPVWSQEVSASITGTITDASGAVVVNAAITAKDVNRGTVYTTSTNEAGIYLFPRIPPGMYEVKVEAKGFKTVIRQDIILEVNQRARLDVGLEVGALTESVQVTGEPPLLQTDTTIVGTTITTNRLANTPLISRNFITLTLLAPGVTTTNPSGFNNDQRTTGGGRPYVNGNRKEANNFLLDGIDNNQVSDNLTSYQPNLEAISEVKMITNNASAEFGNFQGGIINVTLKSGTNQFHGSLFEYFKNDKLNANAWARNWNIDPTTGKSLPRGAVRYNAFGGTFGGPVIIPKVVNGTDKLFFFTDFQAVRRPFPRTIGTPTVMPTAFRRGDFSQLLNPASDPALAGRQPIQLYNPFSLNAAGARQPFAGNLIPASQMSPVANKLLNDTQFYPQPLIPALRLNYQNSSWSKLNSDQGDGKFDWKASNNDDFSFRYSQGMQNIPGFNDFPLFFNSFNESPFKAGVLNWTRVFNPRIVNEARFGVNRIVLFNGGANKEGYGDLNEKYGIAGVNSPGLLGLNFANQTFTSSIGSANIGTQQLFANATFHFADNLTYIKSRHMMKMGGQVLRQRMNTFYAGNNGRTGFMTFTGRFTGASSGTVNGWSDADFYLGLPETLGRGLQSGTWGHRKTIWGFYYQDDWRATDRLTLNLGIRWEYHTPLVEVNDRQANFEPFSGKLLLAGKDGNSRALYQPYKKDFQPRIGFAYTPFKNWVLRGAYTISSFMEGTGTNLRLPMNPPFNSEFEGRYDNPNFNLPGSNSSQGLSVLSPTDPWRGINVRLWDPFVRPANTQQWNLTLERQMGWRTVGSVGYVGQKGTHLVVPMPYYQRRLLADGTTERSPYLCCNPQLANITQISGTESNGNQRYDALQSTLTKRMSAGIEFQANYTWSHGMSDAIGYYGEGGQSASQAAYWQYLYDRKAEWGPTYFDARHMFTFTHVWALPFGKGQRWANAMHPVLNGVLGGWQLGGILTLRSGFPLTIQAADNSTTNSRGARARVVGKGGNTLGQVGLRSKWFDTSAYAPTLPRTLGNVGIGTERGPGFKVYDFSIQKQFFVTERVKFEIRGEFINLFNTPQFASPNRSATSATFGELTGAQYERNGQIAMRLWF
jgi:hypothetical protein